MRIFATIDWDTLRRHRRVAGWYAEIVDTVRANVDQKIAQSLAIPEQPGGWLHEYVCQDHWVPLLYDSSDPVTHRSLLGDSYTGEPFDGGWRVWRHRELADLARDTSILHQITGDEQYLNAANVILRGYAQRYQQYAGDPSADEWMLKARAFSQALTESLWAVPLAQAFDLVKGHLTDPDHIETNLLRPISEVLIKAHDNLIQKGQAKHNYTSWFLAALGTLAFTLNDKTLIDRVIDGEGGFRFHLDAAVLPDGMEYEVTPYYHNFVALAYINLAVAAQAGGYDLYAMEGTQGQSIAKMWNAFASLAYLDGRVIEANDGSYWPYSIYDVEICDVYEVAYAQTQRDDFAWLLHAAYQRRNVARDRWTALLWATGDLKVKHNQLASTRLEDSGIIFLRHPDTELEAFISYGNYAGSHSHLDRLSLHISPFSPDPGTPLYGVDARKTWYQQTLAHNTVVVDKRSQEKAGASLDSWSRNNVDLTSDSLYPGVTISRKVALLQTGVTDTTSVYSEVPHMYDWIFHTDGQWQLDETTTTGIDELYDDHGAGVFMKLIRHGECQNGVVARTRFQGKEYILTLKVDRPFTVFIGQCPGRSQSPYLKRQVLVARVEDHTVQYQAMVAAHD